MSAKECVLGVTPLIIVWSLVRSQPGPPIKKPILVIAITNLCWASDGFCPRFGPAFAVAAEHFMPTEENVTKRLTSGWALAPSFAGIYSIRNTSKTYSRLRGCEQHRSVTEAIWGQHNG